jgi:hypothetical protein
MMARMSTPTSPEVREHGHRQAWLHIATAVIVRAAAHMPMGSPERRALARAARELRDVYGRP